MTRALRLENIDEAARCVDPAFLNSPQVVDASMTGRIGRELILKLETFNPVRSFKGRGADFFMRGVGPDTQVVCASAGNFGQAAWSPVPQLLPLGWMLDLWGGAILAAIVAGYFYKDRA